MFLDQITYQSFSLLMHTSNRLHKTLGEQEKSQYSKDAVSQREIQDLGQNVDTKICIGRVLSSWG